MSRPSGIFDAAINDYDGTEDQRAANCAREPLGLIDSSRLTALSTEGVDESTAHSVLPTQPCVRCSRMRTAASDED
jgi:hypothetical protein